MTLQTVVQSSLIQPIFTYECISVFVVIVVVVAAALIASECVQFVVIVLVNIFN